MIRAIIFDFDGTLADTAPGIVATFQRSFEVMGMAVPAEEEIVATIGLPLVKSFGVLGCNTQELQDRGVEVYRELFFKYELPRLGIFPDVKATLAALASRNIRMSVATSRSAGSLEIIMKNNGIDQFFETSITVDDGLKSKPAPDMVLALLERMGLDKEETLVVGDTTFDIGMGNSAGCRTCAVTYGNHSREILSESDPTYIIDHFTDILKVLDQ